MTSMGIRYRQKISRKAAIDKITVYGMFGGHQYQPRPNNRKEVFNLIESLGINPEELVNFCRDYKEEVVCFEKTFLNTWDVGVFKGGKVGLVDRLTRESCDIQGAGKAVLSTYYAQFEAACKARDRAVINSSFMDYHSALTHGIASIESFITAKVKTWNHKNPEDKLIDSKSNKVSLDDKFDIWVPKMSEGAKLVKDDRRWSDFMILRRVRDSEAVHSKQEGIIKSYEELARLINAFRFGIAGMLGQLHLHFLKPVPSIIINAVYMPDVESI